VSDFNSLEAYEYSASGQQIQLASTHSRLADSTLVPRPPSHAIHCLSRFAIVTKGKADC